MMVWALLLFTAIVSLASGEEFLTPTQSIDAKKSNICFATINSENERQAFSQHLTQGPNKGKFNLIELVDGSKNWFEKSCEAKVRCDILFISGEFAGHFFGDKGNLSLEQMEGKSCSNECKGILHDPKEVFLFGCNTLAGKEEDSRSAEEYLNVLLEHGTPLSEAVLRTEERYGAVNSTNRNRFQKVFRSVPHIYGFNSIGPSGKTVQPLLENYLKKVPDYSKHLATLESRKALLLSGKVLNKTNSLIEESLAATAFTQCHGYPTSQEMDEITKLKCLLHDSKKSDLEKLEVLKAVLSSGDIGASINDIHFYLSGLEPYYLTEEEKKLVAAIQQDQNIQKRFLSSMEAIKMPLLKLRYTDLAVEYKWIDQEQGLKAFKDVITPYLVRPLTTEKINLICGASFSNIVDHSFVGENLEKKRLLEDNNGWRVVDCLSIKHPYVQQKELGFLSSSDSKLRKRGIKSLVTMSKKDSTYHTQLLSLINSGDHNSDLIKELEEQSPLSAELLKSICSKDEVLSNSSYSKLLSQNTLPESSRQRLLELSTASDLQTSYTALENFEASLKRNKTLSEAESDIFIKHVLYKWHHMDIAAKAPSILPSNNPEVIRSMLDDLKDSHRDLESSQHSLYLGYLPGTDITPQQLTEIWRHLKVHSSSKAWKKEMVLRQMLQENLDKMSSAEKKEISKSKIFK